MTAEQEQDIFSQKTAPKEKSEEMQQYNYKNSSHSNEQATQKIAEEQSTQVNNDDNDRDNIKVIQEIGMNDNQTTSLRITPLSTKPQYGLCNYLRSSRNENEQTLVLKL